MSWAKLDELVRKQSKKAVTLVDKAPASSVKGKFVMPPVPHYKKLVGVDTETYPITPACQTPRMVCVTFYENEQKILLGGTDDEKRAAIMLVYNLLEEEGTSLVGLNGYYDWAILQNEAGFLFGKEFQEELTRRIYWHMKAGYIRELSILAKLLYIRMDWLDYDPIIQRPPNFGLAELVLHWFNVELEGKKGTDIWRLRYGELDGIPSAQWPIEAQEYALMDAVWAQRVYDKIASTYGHSPDEIFQTVKGWAMYNSGLWGMHLDESRIDALENRLAPIVHDAKTILVNGGKYGGPEDCNPTDDKYFDEQRNITGGVLKNKPPTVHNERVFDHLQSLADAANIPLKRTPSGKPSFASAAIKPFLADKAVFAYVNKNEQALIKLGFATPAGMSKDMAAIRDRVTTWFTSHGEEVPVGKLTDNDREKGKEHGNVKTDREALQSTDDADLRLLAAIGQFDTVLSTFIPAFRLGVGHGVHPFWNPLVSTGRPSVSSPNLNNQPKLAGVRECFRAREGYVLISADYQQAELCSLAQINLNLFGFSAMAEAIRAGKDLHCVVGSQLMGVEYDAFVKLYKEHDKKATFFRQLAKIANFGFPGGQGVDSFIFFARKAGVILDREQVIQLKSGWQNAYPEMINYFNWINKQIKNGREVTRGEKKTKIFDLVHQYTGRVRGGVKFTDGCNSGFQGLTADGASNAYIQIHEEAYFDKKSALYGCGVNAWIYDEFLIEAPLPYERASAAAWRLAEIMKQKMEELTPDVPASVDPAMMINWSKKAELVIKHGIIVPWEMK